MKRVVQIYKGYEVVQFNKGWTVQMWGDEIYCETLTEAYQLIDSQEEN